jgi:hypothetical protein
MANAVNQCIPRAKAECLLIMAFPIIFNELRLEYEYLKLA